MGTAVGAPINELVAVLAQLDPSQLEGLKSEFPGIAAELQPGRLGGVGEERLSYDRERAEVSARALVAVANRASVELVKIQRRMVSARRYRLIAQVLTLVCSSGVLASLAMKEAAAAIVTSLLTLLASIGTLVADHGEKLLKPGQGDVYEAFEQASSANFKARKLVDDLRLMLRNGVSGDELSALVTTANQLAEELNGWVVRMSGSA